MAVTRKGTTIVMSSQGDFLPGKYWVNKVTFYCGGQNYVAKIADKDDFVHINGRGRQFTTVQLDFDKSIFLDGIKLTEKTSTIPAVYVYID